MPGHCVRCQPEFHVFIIVALRMSRSGKTMHGNRSTGRLTIRTEAAPNGHARRQAGIPFGLATAMGPWEAKAGFRPLSRQQLRIDPVLHGQPPQLDEVDAPELLERMLERSFIALIRASIYDRSLDAQPASAELVDATPWRFSQSRLQLFSNRLSPLHCLGCGNVLNDPIRFEEPSTQRR
jgi:hypothetical protein